MNTSLDARAKAIPNVTFSLADAPSQDLRTSTSLPIIKTSSLSVSPDYFTKSQISSSRSSPPSPLLTSPNLPSPSLSIASTGSYKIRRVPPPALSPADQELLATYGSSGKARSTSFLPLPGQATTNVASRRSSVDLVSNVPFNNSKFSASMDVLPSSPRSPQQSEFLATQTTADNRYILPVASLDLPASPTLVSPQAPTKPTSRGPATGDNGAYRFPYKLILPVSKRGSRTDLSALPSPRKLSTAHEVSEEADYCLFGEASSSLAHEKKDSIDSNTDSIFDTYTHSQGSTSARTSIADSASPRKDYRSAFAEQRASHSVRAKRSSDKVETQSSPAVASPRRDSSWMQELPGFPKGIGRQSVTSLFGSSWSRRSSREEEKPFDSYEKPTTEQLQYASDAMVYTENGDLVRFGDLWESQRTIVCFIRHYWCPSCQDYIASVMRVSQEELQAVNLRLVIVGCGSWKMIPGYRKLLGGCPFPIVSDPTRAVYRQLGMTRTSLSPGQRPSYVQHGMTVNTLKSIKRNTAMPLRDPGELGGLGGEFVLGPGVDCSFAHRMKNTRDHAELGDILQALDVTPPAPLAYPISEENDTHRSVKAWIEGLKVMEKRDSRLLEQKNNKAPQQSIAKRVSILRSNGLNISIVGTKSGSTFTSA